MTSIEVLYSARKLNNKINVLLREKKELIERKTAIKVIETGKERVQGGLSRDFTYVVDKLTDLEEDIVNKIDELIQIKEEVKNLINRYANSNEHSVLYDRYVNCLSWEKLAECNGYSDKHVFKINKSFLEKIK